MFNLKYFLIIIVLLVVVIFNRTNAQFETKYSLQLGMTTLHILGDNPATKPMIERDTTGNAVFGGSFDGGQPGFSLRLLMALDTSNIISIPIGIDFTLFEALERYPVARYVSVKYKHTVFNPTFVVGLNYALVRYPISKSKIYAGLEARGSLITSSRLESRLDFLALDSTYTKVLEIKNSAFRLGAAVRLGIEGQVAKDWDVNMSCAIGVMNLIGRDNSRGELLTPLRKTPYTEETKESYVYNFLFSMSIMYRL